MNMRAMMQTLSKGLSSDIVFSDGTVPSLSLDFTTGAMPAGVTFSRASGGSYTNLAGATAVAAANGGRFDYNPTTHAMNGLLVEEARTNYLLNSSAPVTQTVTLVAGTYTLWVKGSGSCTAAAGTAAGTGFGAATAATPVTLVIATAGTVVFTVSGSLSAFQCENGAFATSLILTTTSSATRSADFCSVPVGGWFNGNEGTLVVETLTGTTAGNRIVATFENTTSQVTSLSGFTTSNAFSIRANGTVVANAVFSPTAAAGSLCRMAGAYKIGDTQAARNGVLSTVTAVTSLPVGLATLRVGLRISDQFFNGWIRKVKYYPMRLPAAKLVDMTKL